MNTNIYGHRGSKGCNTKNTLLHFKETIHQVDVELVAPYDIKPKTTIFTYAGIEKKCYQLLRIMGKIVR
ncbi:hypothetical protein ACLM5H_18625 [Fredinandcohnia humi]